MDEFDEAMGVTKGSLGGPSDADRDDVIGLSPGCSGFGSEAGDLSGGSSSEDKLSDPSGEDGTSPEDRSLLRRRPMGSFMILCAHRAPKSFVVPLEAPDKSLPDGSGIPTAIEHVQSVL